MFGVGGTRIRRGQKKSDLGCFEDKPPKYYNVPKIIREYLTAPNGMGGFTPFLSHNTIYNMTPCEMRDYVKSIEQLAERTKQAREQSEKEAKKRKH